VANREIHQCQCQDCLSSDEHSNQVLHHQLNLFLSCLDERQRRLYVALEAQRLGHGGTKRLSQITGIHVNTIRRGRRELDNDLRESPVGRIRQEGGGRSTVEKKHPSC
jgi:hypothetical protein